MSSNLSNTPPENNLAPQTDNSLVTAEGQSLLRFKGRWAVITTATAAVTAQFSTLFNWGTWGIDWLDRLDFTSTRFIELLRWLFSPRGAQILFVGFLTLFFIAVYRTLFSNRQPQQALQHEPQAGTQDELSTALIESEVAKVREALSAQYQSEKDGYEKQIEELNQKHQSEMKSIQAQHESNITSLQLRYADEIRGREKRFVSLTSEITRLKGEIETQEIRVATRENERDLLKAEYDAHLAQYDWLHTIALHQQQAIDRYVTLDRFELSAMQLNDGVPFVKFIVWLINNSVFDITLELESGGNIYFREQKLHYIASVESSNRLSANRCGEPHISLVIEQRLMPEEADYISSSEAREDAIFYFDRLEFTLKSGNSHLQVKSKPLHINKAVTVHNEPKRTGR
jgi:hypothetical protein